MYLSREYFSDVLIGAGVGVGVAVGVGVGVAVGVGVGVAVGVGVSVGVGDGVSVGVGDGVSVGVGDGVAVGVGVGVAVGVEDGVTVGIGVFAVSLFLNSWLIRIRATANTISAPPHTIHHLLFIAVCVTLTPLPSNAPAKPTPSSSIHLTV